MDDPFDYPTWWKQNRADRSVGCWFCARGTAPGHDHIKRPTEQREEQAA